MWTGNPTGLLCEAAVSFFFKDVMVSGLPGDNKHVPLEVRVQGLELGIKKMNENGIVAFQDAAVRAGNLEAYKKYYSENKRIRAKASLALWWEPHGNLEQIEWMKSCRTFQNGLRIK